MARCELASALSSSGLLLGERSLHVGARGHRGCVGHDQSVGRARIGKEEHGEIEAGLLCIELCVGQVAVALLLLKLGLDHVCVGHLAGRLALLGERGKAGGLVRGALGDRDPAVGGGRCIEEANHGWRPDRGGPSPARPWRPRATPLPC